MTKKLALRSKNIDDEIIVKILNILDGWSGRLTWDLLIDKIEKRTLQRYSRQALNNHNRVKAAYELRKKGSSFVKVSGKKLYSPEEILESQRNQTLKSENERLQAENERLREMFNRWAYNAYSKGITKEQLDTPLQKVHR